MEPTQGTETIASTAAPQTLERLYATPKADLNNGQFAAARAQYADLASPARRFVAFNLETLVAFVAAFAVGLVLKSLGSSEHLRSLVVTGLFVAYMLGKDALPNGQSLVKRWLGMRVVQKDNRLPCTLGRSLFRNLCYLLGALDALPILGRYHRRLGDYAANTIVIKVPKTA